MKFKYGVVITGGIATGKSTVSRMLSYKYKIIDADKIAHEILDSNVELLTQHFGNQIIENNKINRKILGGIVFNDFYKRELLQSLIHPKIRDRIYFESKKEEEKENIYFIDIPLFFESNRKAKIYDVRNVLLVYAEKEMQLRRLMRRDGISRDFALKKIQSQICIEFKKKHSNFVLENTSKLHLEKNLKIILRKIQMKIQNKNLR